MPLNTHSFKERIHLYSTLLYTVAYWYFREWDFDNPFYRIHVALKCSVTNSVISIKLVITIHKSLKEFDYKLNQTLRDCLHVKTDWLCNYKRFKLV